MKFDLVITNPPFQDTQNRGKTPHKLWIDFTLRHFEKFLLNGGLLAQISPASFQSPSSKVLQLFRQKKVLWIDLTTSRYFPVVGSSFAHYVVINEPREKEATRIFTNNEEFSLKFDMSTAYLPNDLSSVSMSIHRKFIFVPNEKLNVEWDYVTCHNILIKRDRSLSREKTKKHKYPVMHTNSQEWWSSKRQEWADEKKVMWSRSGYFRPIFDSGTRGGTDMIYFVRVKTDSEGEFLAHNLNLNLPQYVMKTAKWSGFGNEIVFSMLPKLPNKQMTNEEMYELFGLTRKEVKYVERSVQRNRGKAK